MGRNEKSPFRALTHPRMIATINGSHTVEMKKARSGR